MPTVLSSEKVVGTQELQMQLNEAPLKHLCHN